MGSTTSIQNDYKDRHVVSFVGVNVAAAVFGSVIGAAATALGTFGILNYFGILGAGVFGGATTGAAITVPPVIVASVSAGVELVELIGPEVFFGGGETMIDILPGQIPMSSATFNGLSAAGKEEYMAKLLQAGYATDENKRSPELRKLLEGTDLFLQKKSAEEYAAQIRGEMLQPGVTRAYSGTLSLVRTSYQYTFSCKNAVITRQKGQRTVWTGLTNNSNKTYKVSENNLANWDGK